jgi:hypothetical protein
MKNGIAVTFLVANKAHMSCKFAQKNGDGFTYVSMTIMAFALRATAMDGSQKTLIL